MSFKSKSTNQEVGVHTFMKRKTKEKEEKEKDSIETYTQQRRERRPRPNQSIKWRINRLIIIGCNQTKGLKEDELLK